MADQFEQLKAKYQSVLNFMQSQNVQLHNLQLENNKLLIRATAASEEVKNHVWDQIKLVDLSYSDLIADIQVPAGQAAAAGAGAAGAGAAGAGAAGAGAAGAGAAGAGAAGAGAAGAGAAGALQAVLQARVLQPGVQAAEPTPCRPAIVSRGSANNFMATPIST